LKAIQYGALGGPEQYELREVLPGLPGPGEVLVATRAIGLNPVDVKISRGQIAWAPFQPPMGVGCDFAGTVIAAGRGSRFGLGEEVYGQARHRAAAEQVLASEEQLLHRPEQLPAVVAASLPIPSRTSFASVHSQNPGPGDTVFVSAAAGSVGIIAAQLAVELGARVIGSASTGHHEFLRSVGVIPVEYRGNLTASLRNLAPEGIDIILDNQGDETIKIALELGVPVRRINSTCAYRMIKEHGIPNVGNEAGDISGVLAVAERILTGRIKLPPARTFPFERFREAYELLVSGHGTGKIVLTGAAA
jgi:NADPH:quinone reductase-like Zn-dependent oxidoreductase